MILQSNISMNLQINHPDKHIDFTRKKNYRRASEINNAKQVLENAGKM